MVLHTNLFRTNIISNDTELPFRLAIKPLPSNPFGREKLELIFLDKLVHQDRFLYDVVYPIKEYQNFSLILETDLDCEVTIKLSVIKSDLNGDDFKVFALNKTNPEFEVYKFVKNRSDSEKNIFPWSADVYHFEVIYQAATYYGMLNVIPRNMSDDELEWMRSLINEKLYGLVIDYMKYKRSWSTLDSIQETPFWHLWEWYKNNESKLLNQISVIEYQSAKAISKTYKVQESPKKLDNHSIRWANTPKGLTHNQTKFLNRRIQYIDDSEENRNAKYFIRQIQLKLNEIEKMVRFVRRELIERQERLVLEINEAQKKLTKISSNSRIAIVEKKRYNNIVFQKNREEKVISEQLLNYEEMCNEIKMNLTRLTTAINNEFWLGIAMKPNQRILLGNHPAYKIIYKIYQEMSVMLTNEHDKAIQLPVYKRTEELYEYFAFFSVIDLFISQGFSIDEDDLMEQLKISFYQEGVRDGTTVRMQYDDIVVFLVFDEELAISEVQANNRFSRLMTEQDNRKPDLRLDAYRLVEDHLIYDSSIVLELKCRPLKNIYNAEARTKEMIQMASYKHILRINSTEEIVEKGEKYNNHAIRFVLCLYAGEAGNQKPYIEAACGKFIRFKPQVDEEPTNLAVLEREIFNRWLKILPVEEE